MLCLQTLPCHAYGTRKIVSEGRYIDVSLTEHSMTLQMRTTCLLQELSIKLANCNLNVATWPFSHQKKCVTIMVRLKSKNIEF